MSTDHWRTAREHQWLGVHPAQPLRGLVVQSPPMFDKPPSDAIYESAETVVAFTMSEAAVQGMSLFCTTSLSQDGCITTKTGKPLGGSNLSCSPGSGTITLMPLSAGTSWHSGKGGGSIKMPLGNGRLGRADQHWAN